MSTEKDQPGKRRFLETTAIGDQTSSEPVNLTHDLTHLSSAQQKRRKSALITMLAASETRQQEAIRARRPSMALGQRVAITSGPLQGRQGVVLDADFINSRVLLDVDDLSEPEWLSFKRIGHA